VSDAEAVSLNRVGTVLWILAGLLLGRTVWKFGTGMIRSLGTLPPPPPPPGDLRKVAIKFRCSICGTEVKMTSANDEMPEPPRHCQEDMDLVAPVE
jgi:threonine dehydrogenase-like Zn-dependent dehydrogenase